MIYSIVILDENGGVTETIALDAVLGFGETYDSTITQTAVEDGFNVSDHIVNGNDKYTLNGVVSDAMFMRRGATLTYVNGEFVRLYSDTDPIPDEKPSLVMKKRLKDIRKNREIFGVFCSSSQNQTSEIETIYPCAMTSLSFQDSDGAEAIYPQISFEKIRVSKVEFKTVENPTPQLVPYVKHAGNQTGSDGSTKIDGVDVDDSDLLKKAKTDAKDLVPKEPPKEKTWADKKVTELSKEEDRIRFSNEAEIKFRKYVQEGKFGWGDKGPYVNNYVKLKMQQKYGADK